MLNLLGNLGGLLNLLPPEGSVPGFAGGQFGGFGRGPLEQWNPPMLDNMGGVDQALARNAELGRQQQQQAEQPKKRGGGLGNFLGRLGDALLIATGEQPQYEPRQRQKRVGEALSGYFGGRDPRLAAILREDPEAGLAIYKMMQPDKEPDEIRLMRLIGIDPASEEGRAIITRKLSGGGGADPNFIRELEALGIDPRSPEALELYYGRNSPAGYLLRPKARPTGPVATNGPSVGQVVNGFRFKGGNPYDKGNWESANGGPASPSPATFR